MKLARGRPRKSNPSADAIRMRKVYDARKRAGECTNPSAYKKRRSAALKVRNYRKRECFGVIGERAHELGTLAGWIYSRPVMRVGVHLPSS